MDTSDGLSPVSILRLPKQRLNLSADITTAYELKSKDFDEMNRETASQELEPIFAPVEQEEAQRSGKKVKFSEDVNVIMVRSFKHHNRVIFLGESAWSCGESKCSIF